MWFLLFVVLFLPSTVFAAYQNPTVVSVERKADGSGNIVFQFTGNAGEPVITRIYSISSNSTIVGVRNWVDDTIIELNLVQTAAVLPGLQAGQTVIRLPRTNTPQTPKQIWQEKLARYLYVKDAGIVAATSELATLKSDLEATYQSGFLGN